MRSILPRKVASVLVRAAHDPPKCERFGDKIMRFLNEMRARSDAKPASTFADRALALRRSSGRRLGRTVRYSEPAAGSFVHDMFYIKLTSPKESILSGGYDFRE